jgi:hypothetical protein
MKRRNFKRVVAQLAARAFHRELNAAPACNAHVAHMSHGRHIVQIDRHGDAYPALDLRRCWRPNGIYRTPLLTSFEVRQS